MAMGQPSPSSSGRIGLNALLAASQANDSNRMDRAYLLALDGRGWTDTVVPSIVASKQVSAADYTNSIRVTLRSALAAVSLDTAAI
jgi:hypothetical protein